MKQIDILKTIISKKVNVNIVGMVSNVYGYNSHLRKCDYLRKLERKEFTAIRNLIKKWGK